MAQKGSFDQVSGTNYLGASGERSQALKVVGHLFRVDSDA